MASSSNAAADAIDAVLQSAPPPATSGVPSGAPVSNNAAADSIDAVLAGKSLPTPSNDDKPGWRDYVGSLGASMSHAAMTSIPRLAEGAANLSAGIMSKITGHEYPGIGHPISGAIESGINAAIPPPPEKNYGEHLINQFGTGAGDIAGPALLTKALGAAEVLGPKAADIAQKITGPAVLESAPYIPHPTNIAAGGLANVAGNEAANQKMIPIPEFAKPTVATVAGLAGGLVGAAPEIAVNAGKAAASRVLPSVTRDAGELAAGQRMVREATDPNAALENLRNGASTIPDLKLTTGQQSADPGLAQAEMAVRDQKNKGEFVQRTQDQNEALTNHISAIQPKGADASPADVAAHVREIQASDDALHVANVGAAKAKAETAAGAVTSDKAPEDVGTGLRDPAVEARDTSKDLVDKIYEAAESTGKVNVPVDSIAKAANDITAPRVTESKPMTGEESRIFGLAKDYEGTKPLANIRALRSAITDEMSETRGTVTYGRLNQLRKAIDQSFEDTIKGKFATEPETQAAVQKVIEDHYAQSNQQAAVGQGAPGNVEGAVGANTGQGPANTARQNGTARPITSGSYPASHGTGLPTGPAPEVKFTEEQAAAANKGRDEGLAAAARGTDREHDIPDLAGSSTKNPEKIYIDRRTPKEIPLTNKNTGKVDQVVPDPFLAIHERVERNLQALGMGQKPAHARATIVEHRALEDAGYKPAEYEAAMGKAWKNADHPPEEGMAPSDLFKKGDYTSRQIKEIKAAQPVSENAPEAVAKLKEANTAYREHQEKFGAQSGAVGKILTLQPRGMDFKVSDASVPGKIFHPGDTGGEDVRSYVNAVGAAKAAQPLEDAAAYSFNKAAMRDGVVNAKKAANWLTAHATALKELPVAVRAKFQSAASSQITVEKALVAQHEATVAAQKSALSKVSGLTTDEEVSKKIGGMLTSKTTGPKDLGELADAVKGNADAENGLKRAVIEGVLDKFSNSSKVGVGDTAELSRSKLSNFFKDNTPLLEKVLAPEQVGKLRAVITEMNKINRTVTATKSNPGGPNTAQRLAHQEPQSVLGHAAEAFGAIAGEKIGEHVVGGALGSVGGAGAGAFAGKVISYLKDLSVRNQRQIAIEIAMNPKKGAEVMSRAMYYKPEDIKGKILDLFGTALRGASETGMRQTGK